MTKLKPLADDAELQALTIRDGFGYPVFTTNEEADFLKAWKNAPDGCTYEGAGLVPRDDDVDPVDAMRERVERTAADDKAAAARAAKIAALPVPDDDAARLAQLAADLKTLGVTGKSVDQLAKAHAEITPPPPDA
jgi:hypothetical protein